VFNRSPSPPPGLLLPLCPPPPIDLDQLGDDAGPPTRFPFDCSQISQKLFAFPLFGPSVFPPFPRHSFRNLLTKVVRIFPLKSSVLFQRRFPRSSFGPPASDKENTRISFPPSLRLFLNFSQMYLLPSIRMFSANLDWHPLSNFYQIFCSLLGWIGDQRPFPLVSTSSFVLRHFPPMIPFLGPFGGNIKSPCARISPPSPERTIEAAHHPFCSIPIPSSFLGNFNRMPSRYYPLTFLGEVFFFVYLFVC